MDEFDRNSCVALNTRVDSLFGPPQDRSTEQSKWVVVVGHRERERKRPMLDKSTGTGVWSKKE